MIFCTGLLGLKSEASAEESYTCILTDGRAWSDSTGGKKECCCM